MPRSLWNGTIAFGQVNVPVKLYSAVQSKTVSFRQVHLADGARIEHRRFCTAEDQEIPYAEVVKGFEVAPDEYVVLSEDEVKAAAGRRTKIIDVEHFIPVADIDPVFFDRTYFLGAQDEGAEAYRLLHDALKKTGRAAAGRFVFHNREYLAAIRSLDGVLALHTMRYADEVVSGDDVDIPDLSRGPTQREIDMAAQLVEGIHEDFDAEQYNDDYREAVLSLIEAKAAGEEVDVQAEDEQEEDTDLAAALQASLKATQDRHSRGKAKATA